MATGEGNLRYYYFWGGSNFRRFNFQHTVAVRKLNPFENNRLYGSARVGADYRIVIMIAITITITPFKERVIMIMIIISL